MVKFDKNVPMPLKGGKGRASIYSYGLMEVGDSFDVPPEYAHRARLAASSWKRKNPGWDYVTRKENDGLRVWRTA